MIWATSSGLGQDQPLLSIEALDASGVTAAFDRGADPNLTTRGNAANLSTGRLPIRLVLYHKQGLEGILDALLRGGADPNTFFKRFDVTYAPLHEAVGLDNQSYVRTLLNHEANANLQSARPVGYTPLMYTKSYEMAKLLLESGANPNIVASDGRCVMNFTGKEPNSPIWRLLKQYGGRPRRSPDTAKHPCLKLGPNRPYVYGWKPKILV